jgi:hypothetical protein
MQYKFYVGELPVQCSCNPYLIPVEVKPVDAGVVVEVRRLVIIPNPRIDEIPLLKCKVMLDTNMQYKSCVNDYLFNPFPISVITRI